MKNKVTIVTGGAQGIGRAIADFLAARGSNIAVFDVVDGSDTVRAAESHGVRAAFFQVDVTDYEQVERSVKAVISTLGGIDNLVNNAGITRDKLLLRMTDSEWDLVMRVNLKGVFNCTKAVVRHLLRKGGSIVNIASVVGMMGNAGQSNYAASKAGIIGFTKSIAKEYAERDIRVNAVAPGYINTEMTAGLDEAYQQAMKSAVPLRRVGEPVEVARTVYFLLSDLGSYVTGEVINVSGGLYM
jgi:3-oxoacyl-[acyl-carrier protein] reductase